MSIISDLPQKITINLRANSNGKKSKNHANENDKDFYPLEEMTKVYVLGQAKYKAKTSPKNGKKLPLRDQQVVQKEGVQEKRRYNKPLQLLA